MYMNEIITMRLYPDSLRLENIPITNVADPTNPQDVATKAYVDADCGLSVWLKNLVTLTMIILLSL